MPNGFGRGYSGRGGWGFGFRGSSPPWPYVGMGRGGLPRCWYFLGGGVPVSGPYPPAYGQVGREPYPAYGAPASTPGMAPEAELDYLKSQADTMKRQLEQIEARTRDLESGK